MTRSSSGQEKTYRRLAYKVLLGSDIENAKHHFISRMSHHPTGLRINFTGDVAA
jgi:hypothetical protein